MKVELELKNGKRRAFNAQVAKVLVARGIGREVVQEEVSQRYMTRDMRCGAPAPVQENPVSDELSELKAEADRRGIKYHHRAGVAKLRALLEG